MSIPLLTALRTALRRAADPAKAAAMQAYMKSAMPYLGVPVPRMRAVSRDVFAAYDLPTAAAWRRSVLAVWRGARYREERYAAITLSGDRRAASFQALDALPMYEEMIVTGAWWDYVDEIAVHRLGPLLRRHPRPMARTMRAWSRSADLWKRRSAILCQLAFKRDTDRPLLYDCIAPSLGSPEFFLRKAIGWALREFAKTDPSEVVRWVRANDARLSPLSRREALRNVAPRPTRRRARTPAPRRAARHP